MSRHCSRTGCSAAASMTLTYQYSRSDTWLDNLAREKDPHSYDLCERHGERLNVPSGWRLEDRRHQPLQLVFTDSTGELFRDRLAG